ncbi:uncharacterized protein BT62DRAFT_294111 [Guyanagaster necrorhizus]|uniref:Acyl-CoA desaturase n=1 Tax=Guyanagaster necrorhizus TaxID=856835 RepID=A0A9P7W435_9AGAR|nr:uncharacterized protein BT62DRAFT_294111 [Guyanagaster necrorhizus MCA 3950]KAG7452278.1 hypothetical protein BT62DRAFT_294111 [Guyanagaster necrorhizus MCA 3950]
MTSDITLPTAQKPRCDSRLSCSISPTTIMRNKIKAPSVPKIWWSNAVFFVSVHIAAFIGVYYFPVYVVHRASLFFAFLVWQLADFGITIGYHRLYSHRAFRANTVVRIVLAALGSAGFQGSIKWWCLRHRLHHRFTDDPMDDPYAATRGLLYSHMGWIFFKPTYQRMELIDRDDLDSDPVVRFQHKYYVSIALFFGFVFPPMMGSLWGDPKGAFIWAGLVSRLAIWHCTFLVNSLAHWDGLQPYSDEDTSRGNLLLALLTGGEGNHNFHTFPHDFRSGPSRADWDPSKWIIVSLHKLGFVTGLRRARRDDISESVEYMRHKCAYGVPPPEDDQWDGPNWTIDEVQLYIQSALGRCVLLIDDFVVDVTSYMGEHPGGAAILRKYAFRAQDGISDTDKWKDATWAFEGGLNNHSRSDILRKFFE